MPSDRSVERTTAGVSRRRTYTAPVTEDAQKPPAKPRQVLIAAVALGVAALFSVLTAVGVSTQRHWVNHETIKVNASAVASAVSSASKHAVQKSLDVSSAGASASRSAVSKYPTSGSKLTHSVDTTLRGFYVSALFTVLVLAILGYGLLRGRHWVRWGVTGVYVLSLFTPLGIGPLNLVSSIAGGGEPSAIRVPTLIAALAMLIAVVMVNLRPSIEFFALSRPAPRPGAPARRGLFSRPPAAPARGNQPQRAAGGVSLGKTRPARTGAADGADATDAKANADRARAKKRAGADAAARGAELARSRAKAASKSRRTER